MSEVTHPESETAETKIRSPKSQLRVFPLSSLGHPIKMLGGHIKFGMLLLSTLFSFWSWVFFLNLQNINNFRSNFQRDLVEQTHFPTAVRKGFIWLRRRCLVLLLPKWRLSSVSSSPTGSGGSLRWEKIVAFLFKYFFHVMMDEDLSTTNFISLIFFLLSGPGLWFSCPLPNSEFQESLGFAFYLFWK